MIKRCAVSYMGHCKICSKYQILSMRDDTLAGGICDECIDVCMDAELELLNEGLLAPDDRLIWRNP